MRTGELITRYFNIVYQPLRNTLGEITGIIASATEVTSQVEARQQLEPLNRMLEERVRERTHPLEEQQGLPRQILAQVPAMMQGSVARFQQTIGHLTDISQLQQADAPETVDLNALIRDVRLDLAPLLEAAPATLTVRVDGCTAVRVAPKTLRSVVYNLLSNAVKYRAPSRPALVQLRAYCTPGHLVLTLQYNILGLSDIQQGEIFGMFCRLHTHVEGSGVGLFTVKRLVDNAGGTIAVASQLGIGSTFTISLPA